MNKCKNRTFVLWTAVFLMAFMVPFVSAKSPGPCRYSVSDANGRLQLENDFILLEMDPSSGGRGTRLFYKSADGELTVQGPDIGKGFPDGGLFGDRLVGGGNEFLVATYSVEVKKQTDDEISVLLSHKGGNWVLFEKLVTLKRDCSSIEVLRSMSYAMLDPNNAPKQKLGLWSHQSVRAGTSKDNKALKNTFFIPTARGILEVPFIPGVTQNPKELDNGCDVRDCSRGWVGVVGEDAGKGSFGAVYQEDFSNLEYLTFYLDRTFAELPTSEFFHYVREMSDGNRFEVATSLVPVRGLKTIAGAGQGIVGGIDRKDGELQKGKEIKFNISLYSDRTREVAVSVYVERLPEKKANKLSEQSQVLDVDTPVNYEASFTPDQPGTYVIRVEVKGKDGKTLMEMEKPLVIPPESGVYAMTPAPRTPPKKTESKYVRKQMTGPESPHEKWFNPLAGESPHVLFILAVRQNLRLVCELTQRMSMTYDYVFNYSNSRDPLLTEKHKDYQSIFAGMEIPDKDEEGLLAEYLKRDNLDCIVLPRTFSFKTLSEGVRRQLAERIRGGVGLVIFPFRKEEIDILLEKGEKIEPLAPEEQTNLLPAKTWDLTGAFPYTNKMEGAFQTMLEYDGQPLVVGSRLGKGRVIGFTAKVMDPMLEMATRKWRVDDSKWIDDKYKLLDEYQEFPTEEYNDYLVCRMILWASKKTPPVQIISASPSAVSIERGTAFAIELSTENRSPKEQAVSLEWKIKDPFDRDLAEQKEPAFTAAPGAKKTISISPSTRLADGRYIMRLFLKDKNGKVLDSCAVPFSVESPVRVKGVTVKQRRCAIGAGVEGTVNLISKEKEESDLRMIQELVEPSKRVLYRSEKKISLKEGEKEINFSVKIPETRALILDLRTLIMRGKEPLAERIDYVVVDNPPDRAEIRFEGYSLEAAILGKFGFQCLADAGVGLGGCMSDNQYGLVDFNPYFECLKSGLRIVGARGGVLSSPFYSLPGKPEKRTGTPNTWPAPVENNTNNCWRSGYCFFCYEDPRFTEQAKSDIKRYGLVDTFRLYGPEAINRGDEACLQYSTYEKQDEVCFCEHHLKKFRKWLQQEYGTLENLNKGWDANYKNWEEVLPLPARMAKDQDNKARFVDFRIFMCKSFAQTMIGSKDLLEEAGLPDLKGYGGPIHWESPFTCHLAYYVSGAHAKGKIMPYIYLRHFEPGRSYPQESAETAIIGGYDAWPGHTYMEEKYYYWKSLLYGIPRFSFYDGITYLRMAGILTLTFEQGSLGKWVDDFTREMKDTGIAKTIMTSSPEPYRVGVVESYRSIMAAYVEPEQFNKDGYYCNSDSLTWRMARGWSKYEDLLYDLGISWRIVNEEEVAKGMIPEGMKVLILPAVTCVSPELWQALERFMNKGGVVIADLRLGERDGHGKINSYEKELSGLFGIKRDKRQLEPGTHLMSLTGGLAGKGTLGGISREAGITLAGGKADGRYLDGTPSVIFKDHQKEGCGIYLNFTPQRGANTRELFSKILEKSGVKPFVKLNNAKGGNIAGIFSRMYYRGPNTYIGLLSKGTQENVVLHFPKEAYIYEMGERGFLEYSNKAQVSLRPVIGKMLAILPYKVSDISIDLPPRVKQGEAFSWKAVLKAESGQPGDHVFNVTVKAPDGEKSKSWSGNELAIKGTITREWKLAYNELPGKWEITVRDSVSGKEAKASFVVSESDKIE